VNKRQKTILIISASAIILSLTLFFIVRKRKGGKIKCSDKVLFLGNSQTANSNSYVERLSKHCGSNFTKISKVGAKSDWILDEYKDEIKKGKKYNWVSIMIGGNDIFARKSIDKAKKNLNTLFALAQKQNSKVLVITSPSKLFYSKTTPTHLQLADDLEKWLKQNKNVDKFISITKESENKDYFARDNLHLNSKGQEMIFKKLLSHVK